jgi:cysteine desulfurase
LRALGVEEELAHTSLRIGLGRFTTEAEVDYAADRIVAEVQRLRNMSPLWEMAQEGIDLRSIKWAEH